jgi:hypothetical protein
MTKTFNSFATTLPATESDLITTTNTAMTMLIQVVNPTANAVTCELWMTNASNVHYACLCPSQSVAAYNGISDTAKHIIPNGYKIRGVAGTASTLYFEVSMLEGL